MQSYYKRFTFIIICTLVCLILHVPRAKAQWITQTITLKPGWNAIFLEVDPKPNRCEEVFEGLPIESVWAWNKRFSSVQFIQDPQTLLPEQPEWLTYLPPGKPNAFSTNLFILRGGHAYLINIGGNSPVSWSIKGKPIYKPIDWMSNSFNLVGFHVDPSSPPTFKDYFSSSEAHTEKPIYRMDAFGHWQIIPETTPIQPGVAYWIYCNGHSDYSGYLRPVFEQGRGLEFGRSLVQQKMRIRNESSSVKHVTISKQISEFPPEGIYPSLAGDVLLTYLDWNIDPPTWVDFPGQLSFNIQPGNQLTLQLGVKRKNMPGTPDATYQSIIKIRDAEGSLISVPLTSQGLISYQGPVSAQRKRESQSETVPHPRAGLWIGTATINKVSYPAGDDPYIPKPTSSEFMFRLILHVDATGHARLLQQVILMWQDGCKGPDPNNPDMTIVTIPGEYVLLTDDDLIPHFSGATIKDDAQVGRRISTAAFAFSEPMAMTGNFNNTLTCNGITLDYDHPLNPFKHKYHPDHDNLDYYFDTSSPYSVGKESYTIIRDVTLNFTAENPEEINNPPGWGDNQVGGTYHESFRGVHKKELRVEGIFHLHHVSQIPVLNPAPLSCN